MSSVMLTRKRGTIWIIFFASLFLFTRVAFSEESVTFKPRFSLKITSGWGYLAIGDINRCLGSFNNNDIFESTRLNIPEFITGEITKLNNWIYDWDIELSMDVSSIFPKSAVILATSVPVQLKNESSLTYTYRGEFGDQISTFTFKPEVKTWMPVRLGIRYELLSSSKANVISNAGIEYHFAKASEYRKLEVIPPFGDSYSKTRFWKTKKSGFGFYIGIGMEYRLIKNLALVLEVRGRYVKIANLKGSMQEENIFPEYHYSNERNGTLYYFTLSDYVIGARYSDLEVWEKPPEIIFREEDDIRKAALDLSGFSLRMGIRIKLF